MNKKEILIRLNNITESKNATLELLKKWYDNSRDYYITKWCLINFYDSLANEVLYDARCEGIFLYFDTLDNRWREEK